MKDAIVVGLGPAGITSAIYLLRARLDTLLFEKSMIGGQLNFTDRIENFPGFPKGISGRELSSLFERQLREFSPQILNEEVLKIEREGDSFSVITRGSKFNTLSVVIASGARFKRLGVKGEEEFIGKGVSYCAMCDAPFFKDKVVAVVGGGNTAVEEAIYLSRFVKRLYLIHRRENLRADRLLQERLFALPNVEFIWKSTVQEIGGHDVVRYVVIKEVGGGESRRIIDVDGVFIFVGYIPNTEFLKGILQLDENGYITTDEDLRTSLNGIFACGDVRAGSLKQVISACGEGARAARSCIKYVEEKKGIVYK